MEFTKIRTAQITSYLLLALAVTQALYTILHIAEVNVPRQLLWGLEGFLFTILTAFAGAAMVQAKNYQVGWSAIAFSAVLNVVQVSIGLTMFGPFREASSQLEALGPLAGAVVALSFMIYYAAKLLLGLAALVFGIAKLTGGAKALGGLTALVGVVAMFANTIMIVFGRDAFLSSAVAGGSGVLATLLLALCLTSVVREDQ
ncbi:putative phage tail protein [Zhongshania antarctica]|uniref:Putative phage tail protein n=1 Tax=Zhongshania antarctica TaxID=641702 RepID=A0A840R1W4_9GAMM|nr:thiamine biosynthesis protein ThiC [Zhongshania antarctica]MBB5186401.1 putative phage tail protein [Zhongshania antarctica]